MEIEEIRRLNIISLSERHGRKAIAEKMGYRDTIYINQLCGGHGSFGSSTARKIETAMELPSGWMDATHDDSENPDISLYIHELTTLLESASDEKRKQILEFARFSVNQ